VIFRPRRLRARKSLPHPIIDSHAEAFYGGIAIGVVLTVAVAVIFGLHKYVR
jgi:calcineurin-like phosphoesterase